MQPEKNRRKLFGVETLIWGVLGAEVLYAAAIYILRARFAYDYFFWPESALLTDMLKLRAGAWIYSDPADANSFVYTPGLAYLNFSLLSPFGLALCLPAHRLLNCLYGALAAVFGARAALVLAGPEQKADARGFLWFSSLLLFLVLSANPMFDSAHPDNLGSLLVAANLFLALRGMVQKDLRALIAASCVGAAGVMVKQTLGLLCLADAAAIYFLLRGQGLRLLWTLFPVLLAAAVLGAFLALPYAKFYTFDVLAQQGILEIRRKVEILLRIITAFPLIAIYILFGLWLPRRLKKAGQAPLWAVAALFFLLTLPPALAALFKINGVYNSLFISIFALFILFLPAIYNAGFGAKRTAFHFGTTLFACLMFFPLKQAPPPELEHYADTVQKVVTQAVQAHQKLLLAHGTVALVKAGALTVPLDRAVSIVEMSAGGTHGVSQAGTLDRIKRKEYDIIILNSIWYAREIQDAIERNYVLTGTIRAGTPVAAPGGYAQRILERFIPWVGQAYPDGFQDIAAPGARIYRKTGSARHTL